MLPLPKLNVVGSIPIARSNEKAPRGAFSLGWGIGIESSAARR